MTQFNKRMVFSTQVKGDNIRGVELKNTQVRIMLRELSLPYYESIGSYKGEQEHIFIVEGINQTVTRHMTTTYGQECVLLITGNKCTLDYGGKQEEIGDLHYISPSETSTLHMSEAWTYDSKACSFFIIN